MKTNSNGIQLKRKDRCTVQSFSVKSEDKWILDILDEWARRDRISKSDLHVIALKHYIDKHWRGGGGNPQPTLYNLGIPKPEMNLNLKEARIRQVILFLRLTVKLSYNQISSVTNKSYGHVYRCVKEYEKDNNVTRFDNRKTGIKRLSKNFKLTHNRWSRRVEAYLNGEYETVKEAFTW